MAKSLEELACTPIAPLQQGLNPNAQLPYGLTGQHVLAAMNDYVNFLKVINLEMFKNNMPRIESFLMQANFSSMVGEFAKSTIPLHHDGIVANEYHNGHPDLIPANTFPNNAVPHDTRGIEIKASRNKSGWQGHNPESVWLMVFVFDSNAPPDSGKGIEPKPFHFKNVFAAELEEKDWNFSGRNGNSRRTITASVNQRGLAKMRSNWIYEEPLG